ncbi:uncharacterized protein LOC143289003 isoform X2 [Babylonia areolata]|uniref:uncharacterized protein LOC143289003 isoform X2 n=1 Tax=Babylonia areolata TaxID=304850 RepID=UPI003FD2B92E
MGDSCGVCVIVLLTLSVTSAAVLGQSGTRDTSQYAPSPGLFNRLEEPTDKTIDQLITEALGGIDVASNKILAPGSYVLAELDMYLSQDQFLRLYEPPSNNIIQGGDGNITRATSSSSSSTSSFPAPPTRPRRKAVRDVILRWPGAQVPYQFARGDFTAKERYLIKQSMTEWERYTCLKFRPASTQDTNVVRFQNGEGCNSQLGMVGGVQLLNLDVAGCRFKGLYLHEIGHAIGLVHEHQLPDRDRYINILMHHVAPHFRIFFNKYSPAVVNQYHVPYEYSSVMHYGVTAFSYNARAQTIRAKDPTKEEDIGKVYLKELSFSDVKVVSEMYACSAFCPDDVRCEGDGYLDQNCNCVCPDGTSHCEVRTKQPVTAADNSGHNAQDDVVTTGGDRNTERMDENCENKYDNWKCAVWANQGECERNALYMSRHCTKACGLCDKHKKAEEAKNHFTTWAWQWFGMFTNLFPKDWMIGVCKDVYMFEKCHKWKQQGDCVTNAKWMEENCKMTCNFCGNPALRAETNCQNRHEDDSKCELWARRGECVLNEKWMNDKCPRACHACVDTPEPEDEGEEEEVDAEEEEVRCFDKHDTVQCGRWERVGECTSNPSWMIANCRRTCAKCDDGTCKNLYDDTQCKVWAEEVECLRNRDWMHKNCAKACGVCDTNDSGTESRPDVDDSDNNGGDDGSERDDDGKGKTQRPDVDTGSVTQRPVVTRRPTVRTTTTHAPIIGGRDSCFNIHNDVECDTWAKTGHCDINPKFMHAQCRKACEKCPKDGARGQEVCRDQHPGCGGWAKHGFCESNPRYNLIHCKKACNNCNGCRDQQFLCGLWAKAGHCKTNAGYMLRQCQRACNTCQ